MSINNNICIYIEYTNIINIYLNLMRNFMIIPARAGCSTFD